MASRRPPLAYRRILLKLGGEALCGEGRYGIEPEAAEWMARELKKVHSLGVEIGIVIGGGNIFRGVAASARGMDRVAADHMGMLATIVNGLALQDALEQHGMETRLMTAIEIRAVAEPFIRRRAQRHLEKGRIVLLAGGTGNPYFSTDTAAALRAMEIKADALLKATKVDGIYSADPRKDKSARKVHRITYLEYLKRNIRVMDTTAISLCRDNGLPIVVFSLTPPGNIARVVRGGRIGSIVTPD